MADVHHLDLSTCERLLRRGVFGRFPAVEPGTGVPTARPCAQRARTCDALPRWTEYRVGRVGGLQSNQPFGRTQ